MAQLLSLVKPIESMTDEELQQHLYNLRHRRDVEKPALGKHQKKEKKKERRKESSAAEKLLAKLSPEELAALLGEMDQ